MYLREHMECSPTGLRKSFVTAVNGTLNLMALQTLFFNNIFFIFNFFVNFITLKIKNYCNLNYIMI